MAISASGYEKFALALALGQDNLDPTDTYKMALFTNDYSPDPFNDEFLSQIASHEVVGTGYNTGGVTLTGLSVSQDTNTFGVRFYADVIAFNNVSVTFANAVLYKPTGDANTSRLVSFIHWDTPQTYSNDSFEIAFSNGLLVLAPFTTSV